LHFSLWNVLALLFVITAITIVLWGSRGMTTTSTLQHPMSLDPHYLPYCAYKTVMRMFLALIFALVFSFTYASIAAKNKKAETFLIPLLDILQSVPILGFLSITVMGFIALFPGSLFGVECASIFAIFTSQAWNMTFSLYQSFKSTPKELKEAAIVYRLSPWQNFWRLNVPYAIPPLLWNTMMSISGGWFFVVASEAITVSDQTIMLPGIGSYIALAAQEKSTEAIGYAIFTMFIVILLYDQLLFRPLLAWSEKFKAELTAQNEMPSSWMLTLMRRSFLSKYFNRTWTYFVQFMDKTIRRMSVQRYKIAKKRSMLQTVLQKVIAYGALSALLLTFSFYAFQAGRYFFEQSSFSELQHVFFLGFLTLVRVVILCALASLIWLPIGVMIGLNRRLTMKLQPFVQFMAAFPANLFFPVFVSFILLHQLNPNIWLSPLMILGTQWYILFNVIAGASSIPFDFQELTKNFHVKGWLQWRKLYLPGIFPSYVTGLITAAGGSWNASIVAEYVTWGDTTLQAKGIGSYIAAATAAGDQAHVLLGVVVLCIYVVALNRIFWHPLYVFATTRYRLD
jgi:NitT/TauT family transport system permease protein